jgi:transposase InsO family protein
MEAETNE